jgi:hypothetical protein
MTIHQCNLMAGISMKVFEYLSGAAFLSLLTANLE